MPRFRRSHRSDEGIATIAFYADRTGKIETCAPRWEGTDRLFLLLPALALDEYLPYVRFSGDKLGDSARQRELDMFEAFVQDARQDARDEWPHHPEKLFRDTVPIAQAKSSEDAEITTHVRRSASDSRLWAETRFRPKKARNVLIGLGYQIYWNWVFESVKEDEKAVLNLLDGLILQCAFYRQHGIPDDFRLRQIGRAPFEVWEGVELSTAPPRGSEPTH